MKNIEITEIKNVDNLKKGQGIIQKYNVTLPDNVTQCEKLVHSQKIFQKVNGYENYF